MQAVYDARDLPAQMRRASLALGNFDGVHRGHQAVLDVAIRRAKEQGVPAGVMVFEPHPREFFVPDKPVFRLNTLDVKLELFEAYGLDLTVVMTFDKELAAMRAGVFVEEILVNRLGISHAAAGYDFHFGKDRDGTPAFLKDAGRTHGFAVSIVEQVSGGDAAFSSSATRQALREGRVEDAARALGYRWFVRGEVIKGDARGRELGFPTANIALEESVALRHGIYAVRVRRGDTQRTVHDGVASFGVRPTFGAGQPLLEVMLFDFSGDLYGETLEVEFVGFIRAEETFDGADALIEKMNEDVAKTRAVLAAAPAHDSPLDAALGFASKPKD